MYLPITSVVDTTKKQCYGTETNFAQNKLVVGHPYTQNDGRHDFWIIMKPQYTLLYTLDAKCMKLDIKIVCTLYKRMCQENIR